MFSHWGLNYPSEAQCWAVSSNIAVLPFYLGLLWLRWTWESWACKDDLQGLEPDQDLQDLRGGFLPGDHHPHWSSAWSWTSPATETVHHFPRQNLQARKLGREAESELARHQLTNS